MNRLPIILFTTFCRLRPLFSVVYPDVILYMTIVPSGLHSVVYPGLILGLRIAVCHYPKFMAYPWPLSSYLTSTALTGKRENILERYLSMLYSKVARNGLVNFGRIPIKRRSCDGSAFVPLRNVESCHLSDFILSLSNDTDAVTN